MHHEDDEELSVKEACKLLKIGRWKFYQLVGRGELPTHMTITSRRVMWKSDALAAREQTAKRAAPLKKPAGKAPPSDKA